MFFKNCEKCEKLYVKYFFKSINRSEYLVYLLTWKKLWDQAGICNHWLDDSDYKPYQKYVNKETKNLYQPLLKLINFMHERSKQIRNLIRK